MSVPARRKAVLALLAVFLVGGAVGWVLEEIADEIHWTGGGDSGSDGDSDSADEALDDDAEEEFLETLGLTRAQLDSVDRVLDRREDRLEDYWRSRLPDLAALIDSSRTEIRALLSPEQRAAYDRWLGTQPRPDQP